ncbi:uncharacterized protein LOC110457538 [Mizuhopecten yessoensis]|uniref:uncharacterized protein LOC110457538 n=1 Tax=Mizuhopecten yessoensis TaxID=6573 RepID=UPI000B45A69F|nr:uncharacterized protein LOC110457538 [Mizuhopecten yessoensis]
MTEHIQNEADRALIIEQLVYCSSQSLCSVRKVNERLTRKINIAFSTPINKSLRLFDSIHDWCDVNDE